MESTNDKMRIPAHGPGNLVELRGDAPPSRIGGEIDTAVLDRALVFLLDREESILADIVAECNSMVQMAEQEALELADFLEEQY